MKKFIGVFLTLVLITGGLSACGLKSGDKDLEDTSQNDIGQAIQPTSSVMITEEQAKAEEKKEMIILYFADDQASKLVAEKRFISKSSIKDINTLAQTALNELIKGPISGNLTNPFPKGVKVPTVKVDKKVAVVDFSKEFVEKHPGGSTGETLTIYSIVNTLTAMKDIEMVQFTIEGKKTSEFKGHLEFDKPFKAEPSHVKEEKKEQ